MIMKGVVADCDDEDDLDENDVDYIQWWVTTMMNNYQTIKTITNSTWELHSFLHRYTVMKAPRLLLFPYRSIRSV